MVAALDRQAAAGIERIQRDPEGFFREWLAIDPWAKQIEIAESVRDHRRTAVKTAHGVGKSYIAARIVIWYLHAYPGSIVLTTAPTGRQVRDILWREINAAYTDTGQPLLGRALTQRVEIAPDWYALGFKSDDKSPTNFQGYHAIRILVVVDEAAGVADSIHEAVSNALTSEHARLLLIGNPTNPIGAFRDAFHDNRALYHTITIAAADTPNIQAGRTVRPYLITQTWIDEAIAEHGEESPYVQSRVYARFPTIGDKTLIPLAWIETAHERRDEAATATGMLEAGLDVARFGGDENALCVRSGVDVISETAWTGLDLMETVGRVRVELPDPTALSAIKVDVIGMGAGVADRLKELGYPVVEVNVSSSSSDPEQWPNLRHELWWNLRERFREGAINGPIAQATMGQASNVRYRYDSRHTKPVVESKDEMRKRGVKSPDRAEALMLASCSPAAKPASIVPGYDYRRAFANV